MSFLYGTAGWSYADWNGTVYPQKKPKDFNHLEFLARDFDFVEVNTTFYRLPSEQLVRGWVNKTEHIPHFQFWIKIHQHLTHKRQMDRTEIDHFFQAIQPLVQQQKLSGLLAQFPYSFKSSADNLDYILKLRELFAGYPLAVEFRHRSWNRNDTLRFFRDQELVWVNIDQPVISQSLPMTTYVTHNDFVYVRLHGRNYENWFADKGRDARYDYDYSMEEIKSIADKLKKLKKMAQKVFVSGNNHYKGSAVKNLKVLKKLMGQD